MKSTFKALKDVTVERIKSPLISSFCISWMLFNWRIILYIFLGEYDVDELISRIEDYTDCYKSILFPLTSSVFYTVLYPYINYRIFHFLNQFEKTVEIQRTESSVEVLQKKLIEAKLKSEIKECELPFNDKALIQRLKMNNEFELAEKQNEIEIKRIESEETISANSQPRIKLKDL